MQAKLFNLSRRLYRALNVAHLRWALRATNRRIARLEADWRASSDLAYAMRRVDVRPAWLAHQRVAMRWQFRQLAAQRQLIRTSLEALGVQA